MTPIVKQKLAVKGGGKVRNHNFPGYSTIGEEEKLAVQRVLDSGVLSRFLGSWHPDFYGGDEVQSFEKEWASHFGVKHAIAVNSATSALYAAMGASGINPGSEVIVSPYTMSASATTPLVYGAIPVFADIEEEYYCLDPVSVEANITEHTRAIIVVDIFGQPYNADAINAIAKKYNLVVIEDCAQAPNAKYGQKFAGTLADMGVYSLNYHKHIHTGEGGLVVTDNDELAERVRLIRNHAEAVLSDQHHSKHQEITATDLVNMIGYNYRMTEIEAAIGREQLKKLDKLVEQRRENVSYLNEKICRIPCIKPTKVREGTTHSFYFHPLQYVPEVAEGVHRNDFLNAVKAELAPSDLRVGLGVRIGSGYVKPLYWQPMFQKRIALGSYGFPWSSELYKGQVRYDQGICPVTEKMHMDLLFTHELMTPGLTTADLNDVISAFEKVWENLDQLR